MSGRATIALLGIGWWLFAGRKAQADPGDAAGTDTPDDPGGSAEIGRYVLGEVGPGEYQCWDTRESKEVDLTNCWDLIPD